MNAVTENIRTTEATHSSAVKVNAGISSGWNALGRSGQAVILFSSLVAVLGVMLATAGSAYAGGCTATMDIAALDPAFLLPVA